MRFHFCVLFCAALLFTGCASESGTSSSEISTSILPENHNPIVLNVGDSWTYRIITIDVDARNYSGRSDTMVTWHSFRLTKDTLIGGIPFSLIEEVARKKNGEDSLLPGGFRSAIHSDSSGITDVEPIMNNAGFSIFAGRQSVGDSLLNEGVYVYDVSTPIVFPLVKGNTFSFRPKMMSGRTEELKQIYLGQYEIQTQEGMRSAWKFKTLYSASENYSRFSNVETWIGINGLLHKQTTTNTILVYDSLETRRYVQRNIIEDYWGRDILSVDDLK